MKKWLSYLLIFSLFAQFAWAAGVKISDGIDIGTLQDSDKIPLGRSGDNRTTVTTPVGITNKVNTRLDNMTSQLHVATPTRDGRMSKEDKKKVDSLVPYNARGSVFSDYTTVISGNIRTHTVDFVGGQGYPSAEAHTTQIVVYVPSTYTDGSGSKWAILLHGGDLSPAQYIYAGSPYVTQAEALGIVLIAPDGSIPGKTPAQPSWIDIPLEGRVNYHLDDAIRFAREVYNLNDFKPSLYGMSWGGWKTLYEMTTQPDNYSNFGASAPPVDLIQWAIDDPSNKLVAAVNNPYPTGNALWDSFWTTHSIDNTISTAPISNKRLWLAYGTADEVLDYTHHYTPLVANIPPDNLAYNHLVSAGTHVDFGPNYITELFTHFSNAEPAFSQAREIDYNGNRALTIGENTSGTPKLGQAGFAAFQAIPTLFTGVYTGVQGVTGGGVMSLVADPGAAMLSGNSLGAFSLGGALDANHNTKRNAAITAYAAGNWTPTSAPSRMVFATAPDGALEFVERLKIESDGVIGLGTGGMLKFADSTTQSTAAKPVCTVREGAVQFNSTGDLSCHAGLYYSSSVLYANDVNLLLADPTFLTDDYTTVGLKTAPSSTIFKGLSDRIPVITSGYIPFSAGTVYTGDAGFIWDNTNKRLGINATPALTLHVSNTGAAASRFVRTGTATNTAVPVIQLYHSSTADVVDGFGPVINFSLTDSGASDQSLGQIGAVRDGADNSGALVFRPSVTGSATEKLRIASSGLMTHSNSGGYPFGHQYFNDITGLTIAVAAANTWYEIDGAGTTFTAGQLKNVTQSDHYLVATTAGYYKADYCVSIDTANPGDEIAATVMVNGTANVSAHSHSTVAAGNSAATVCGTTFLNLAANDQISIAVLNHTAARDIIVHHAQLGLDYKGAP